MHVPSLSARLDSAADYVRIGSITADIGCDHGKLAVHLALTKCPLVYACDVNPLPLQRAVKTVQLFRAEHKVQLLLSDGLRAVPHTIQDIVMTGMGGELISKMLFRESWIYSPSIRLILQPQSFIDQLRKNLYQNGFYIVDETPIIEQHHTYCIICAEYNGLCRRISNEQAVLGTMPNHSHHASKLYLQRQYIKYKKIVDGMQKAKLSAKEISIYQNILHALTPWKES